MSKENNLQLKKYSTLAHICTIALVDTQKIIYCSFFFSHKLVSPAKNGEGKSCFLLAFVKDESKMYKYKL
jgi:hypothetical protein